MLGVENHSFEPEDESETAQAFSIMDAVSDLIDQLSRDPQSPKKKKRGIHFGEGPDRDDYQQSKSKENNESEQQLKEIVEISNSSGVTSLQPQRPEAARRADHKPAGLRQRLHS